MLTLFVVQPHEPCLASSRGVYGFGLNYVTLTVTVLPLTCTLQVSAGDVHVVALTAGGDVFSWLGLCSSPL
jgi:hypothetical protein